MCKSISLQALDTKEFIRSEMDILVPAHIGSSATQQLPIPLLKIYLFSQKYYLKDVISLSKKY